MVNTPIQHTYRPITDPKSTTADPVCKNSLPEMVAFTIVICTG